MIAGRARVACGGAGSNRIQEPAAHVARVIGGVLSGRARGAVGGTGGGRDEPCAARRAGVDGRRVVELVEGSGWAGHAAIVVRARADGGVIAVFYAIHDGAACEIAVVPSEAVALTIGK